MFTQSLGELTGISSHQGLSIHKNGRIGGWDDGCGGGEQRETNSQPEMSRRGYHP